MCSNLNNVWVLSHEGHCENFTNDPGDLTEDTELCMTGTGCTFCPHEPQSRSIYGVYQSAEAARDDLLANHIDDELLGTVEWRQHDTRVLLGVWLFTRMRDGEHAGEIDRYLIERHVVLPGPKQGPMEV